MNMILHGNEDADIRKGDTITSPQFTKGAELQTFDFAVANPPFSIKSWSNGLENEFGRFEYGRPPEKNGDYAFLLHVLKSLKSTGKAAVILPHGVLFRGNAEATIRRQLLKRGFIKGIIGLPANLFYGTGIPACIVVLDKENAQARTGVFMIDASKGFMKDGPKNRLRSQDIHKIVDVFNKQTEIERYSRMVPLARDRRAEERLQPQHPALHRLLRAGGHPGPPRPPARRHPGPRPRRPQPLLGRVPVSLRATLFKPNRPGYSDLAIDVAEVQQTILDSAEFQKFAAEVTRPGRRVVRRAPRPPGRRSTRTRSPTTSSPALSDDLLARFKPVPLLDEYDVYEQLMSYWHERYARRRLPDHERWLGRRRQATQDDRGQGPQALRDA